jgi:hypothetical protein
MGMETTEAGDVEFTCPPQVEIINDTLGMQIIGLEGQTIELMADETVMTISPEIVEIEAPDISLTAEAAIEVTASDLDVTTGAIEIETGDLSLSAGAVEVETGLFTVL